jgi:hypothetical protein
VSRAPLGSAAPSIGPVQSADDASRSIARLAADLVGPAAGAAALRIELTAWLASSPRFRRFATTHAAKIHKKIRGARDADALRDVRAELIVARRLLADRRFDLTFEPHGSGRGGPDLAVAHRGRPAFELEVTRRREPVTTESLAGIVLGKLRQLGPGIANLLLIAVETEPAAEVDAAAAVRLLRARADARDEPFLAPRGFATSRAFYDRFLRLGGVVVWVDRGDAAPLVRLWINGSARIKVPPALGRAVLGALSAAD